MRDPKKLLFPKAREEVGIEASQVKAHHCRANMAHVRQSRPDSGPVVQVKVLNPLQGVPFSLGRGSTKHLLPKSREGSRRFEA